LKGKEMSGKTNNSKYVGDCTPKGVIRRASEVYKMSNVKNPMKTDNLAVDLIAGQIPLVKDWNKGFNIGKFGFMAQQTFKDTCKRKK
jgi:hypothetical protein